MPARPVGGAGRRGELGARLSAGARLGRRDGILQPVGEEARAKPKYVGGRTAAHIKRGILKISLWGVSHPTFGLPKRRHRLAAAQDASAEKALA
ncbi:hypothetical protein Ssi02_64220 [Sinosporangium siamense]|uniref:Uncharacterized protein n=1 Tax=Sinosporangium siamense TaxID=1367973 RepID=A0A919RPS6_9ACTN|nr:hypothetical protein Ssi02_64220 [Sinosporangium siamense]